MKLSLYLPVKPFDIVQGFGADYDYYHRVFGTNGHMGLDFRAAHGTPVFATHDGSAFYIKDPYGGEGCYIETDAYEYKDGLAKFQSINWHLIGDTDPNYPCPIPMGGVRTAVKAGDLIGYANNTGAPRESNGDHLHFGLRVLNQAGVLLEPYNGFDGCIDPQPYLNGLFASDLNPLALVEEGIQVASQAAKYPGLVSTALNLLKSLGQFICSLKQ